VREHRTDVAQRVYVHARDAYVSRLHPRQMVYQNLHDRYR
jgi:hypothetical protein